MRRIAIIGGGFAGISAAQVLQQKLNRMKGIEFDLFSNQSHFFASTKREEIAIGKRDLRKAALPLSKLIQSPIRIHNYEIKSISPSKRRIHAQDPISNEVHEYAYDYAILATGTELNWRGLTSDSPFLLGCKSARDFLQIYEHIYNQLEEAKHAFLEGEELEEILPNLNFTIIGAGPTGVSLMGALISYFSETGFQRYPDEFHEHLRLILIDADSRVLTEFPKLSESVSDILQSRGVELRLKSKVIAIDENEITFEDQSKIESNNIFWCAGVHRKNLLQDPSGRIVDSTLRHLRFPEFYIAGDYRDHIPGSMNAHCAIAQGKLAANNIIANLSGRRTSQWKTKNWPLILNIGGNFIGLNENQEVLQGRSAKILEKAQTAKLLRIWRGNRTEGFKQILSTLL